MVQITQFLRPTVQLQSTSTLPLLNQLFGQHSGLFTQFGPEHNFKTFMRWARKSPHLMGFLNIIATDMLSDNISFRPVKEGQSGRNRVLKAEEFWKVNQGLEIAEETLYDLLITGVGFNWIGLQDEVQVKEFCDELAPLGQKYKQIETKADQLYEQLTKGEISSLAKKLRHLPSTTVDIKTNKYEITGYTQKVGLDDKHFKLNEVIMFKLLPLDGKPYPFAPMEAILSEVYLLWLITQNNVSFFENGGHPDKVFTLPKEIAGSKNHQYLIDTLTKYKKIQNKHGNLVFTGELDIKDLQKIESQMENKDLGLYIVGVLAMMYGVPVGRIPFLVGKAASKGDAGGLADSGYWRKMSVWQAKFENAYNTSLFNQFFGVNIKFARGYKQDEVRETQNDLNKTSVAEQRIKLGLWTPERAGDYLGIDPEDIKKAQAEKEKRMDEMLKTGMQNQLGDNNGNVQNEEDKRVVDKKRQDTQFANQQGGKPINS
jgi:portal protein